MSESVGSIYYEVEADTSKLVNSSDAVDDALARNQSSMKKTDTAAGKLDTSMNKLASGVRKANQSINEQTSAYDGLKRVVAAYLSLRTLQGAIAMSDQYGQMASRIKNATDSTEEYEMVQARLLQTANGTYRALSEAQEVYLSISGSLKDLGYNTSQVLDITDSFSYALVRDAARADQATSAMDAYSKSLMKGKIDADAWASIVAASDSIVSGIAQATGETTQKIKELGASGKLSLMALTEGLRQSRDENQAMADGMETSVADAFVKFKNGLTVLVGKTNEGSGATHILTENVASLGMALQDPETIKAAQELAAGVVGALQKIIDGAKLTVQTVTWMAQELAYQMNGGKAAADDIVRLNDQLSRQQGELAEQEKLLANLRTVDSGAKESPEMSRLRTEIKGTEELIKQYNVLQEQRANAGQAGGPSPAPAGKPKLVPAESGTPSQSESEKQLASLRDQAALAKLAGEERAKLAARQKLGTEATKEEIAEAERLAVEIYRGNEARKAATGHTAKLTEEQKKAKKSAEELKRANEQNNKTIAELSQQLGLAGLNGKELMQAQAQLQLNEYATPGQVKMVRDLAGALYDLDQQKQNKQLLGQLDPMAGESQRYQEQLTGLQKLNDAKLLSDARYRELTWQAEQDHEKNLRALQEERFRAQSQGNELLMATLDELQSASAQVFTGLVTGAMNSTQAAQVLGTAILNQVVSSVMEVGFAWVKSLIMGQTAGAAATAASVGEAAVVSAAWATPAALASLGTLGSNSAPASAGIVATVGLAKGLALAGGRQYGGPVGANGLYRVNENGAPEVFNAANGRQYMLPNQRGEVVSNSDAGSGSGGGGNNYHITIVQSPNITNARESQRSSAQIKRDVVTAIQEMGRYQ